MPISPPWMPERIRPEGFNDAAVIPYGCTIEHIRQAMEEFIEFLAYINGQLLAKELLRLESLMMPATFSGMVGEFMVSAIPKYAASLTKNLQHNGHPDLLPQEHFAGNKTRLGEAGIEVKGSRADRGWQGHNAEDVWLMVFVFDSNRPVDLAVEGSARPFRFKRVLLGHLEKSDWKFSGRSAESRRTITASVTPSGLAKMTHNWIYSAGAR